MKEKIKKLLYIMGGGRVSEEYTNPNALTYLQTQYPIKETSFVADNSIIANYDLLVVVPVYNVEKYIKKNIDSIINQKTKYSVQIVIVDDGATDASGKIADAYSPLENVVVLHKKNGGLSEARNYGMKRLTGRYITFVDSDDYIPSKNAFDVMLDAAYEKNADIVAGKFLRFVEKNGREVQTIDRKLESHGNLDELDPIQELQGFAWGKLYKAELFENICFPVGYWYEDTIIPWLVFPKANTTVYADVMCYAYRNNPNGITASGLFSKRTIESTYITKLVLEKIPNEFCQKREIYNLFITQSFINIQRVKNADNEIIRAIFSIMCELKNEFFGEMKLEDGIYKNMEIEKALTECDYSRMKRILRWL